MGGIKGYRPSLFNIIKHRRRTEWTDEEVHGERLAGIYFGTVCEQMRHEPRARGFSLEAAEFFSNAGFPVPMDLWPIEWWRVEQMPFPRFGEEALGREF